jgi:glycosyltransferase involved in cell wall biosynthesis
MPCYNSEKWLKMALDSLIVHQNCDNYKIFAVNDGSEDHTQEILNAFAAKFPDKLKVLAQFNRGTGAALNRGFEEVEKDGGFDYGTMVTPKNIYYRNFVSALTTALDHSSQDVVMVYADFQYINEANQLCGKAVIHDFKDKTDLVNGYDQGAAFMYRLAAKRRAGPYWRRLCEDYAMAIKLAEYGEFELVPLVLMAFRVDQNQEQFEDGEEKRASEYCRRFARQKLQGTDEDLNSMYPDGINPWKHRYDYEATVSKGLDEID